MDDEKFISDARRKPAKRGNSYTQDLALGEGQAAKIAAFDRAVIADMNKPKKR